MEYSRTVEMVDLPGVYGPPNTDIANGSGPTDYDNGDRYGLRASQACTACRKMKRKCSKELPTCSLCSRMNRECDYSDSIPMPTAEEFIALRQKVADLESKLEAKNTPWGTRGTLATFRPDQSTDPARGQAPSVFPSIFLLDSEMYRECRVSVPKPVITTPQTIESILGSLTDIRDIVERFFENIHLWLPTISRKRLQLTLESPSFELTSDLSLLLLSMKLIAQSGHRTAQDAQSPLYWLVKTYAATVESSGMTTVSMMQSLLLITAYELGHGILPAAYLSSGHCVRFGTLMGIHDRQKAPQILRRPGSFAEIEELRRLWWAAILLDRYSNMGLEQARPGTYDPPPNVVLPADEAAWDQGEMTTSEPLYVSTATSVQAGGFARTCQVAHLMGRTLNTMNDTFTDSSLRFTQALQLHRTLTALSNILSAEAQQNPSRYLTACAMSLGTLMRLYEPFCCTESNQGNHTYEETEMQAASISGMKDVSARVLGLSSLIQTEMDRSLASISPLVADGLYTAAAGFQWIAHETGLDEPLAGYKALRAVLTRLSSRWAVAGEYIKILEVMKENIYQNDPIL